MQYQFKYLVFKYTPLDSSVGDSSHHSGMTD